VTCHPNTDLSGTAASESLWSTLRRGWLSANVERPADPRLAEEARLPARAPGAWLRHAEGMLSA